MATLTPKQREIADRESRILEVARPIIVRDGYHGLKMERIAEELGISKGTIYNHFSCKEEIIIALAIQTVSKRTDMFRQAAQLRDPKTRFRIMAIGQAAERFVRNEPEYFHFEEILRLDSVWEKTSEKRRAVIRTCELQCMEIVASLIRNAVAVGELELPIGMSPEELVFGLWSLTTGAYSIILTSDSLSQNGIADPYKTVRHHLAIFLDGFNWTPLSTEFDVEEMVRRIDKEVFGDD